MRRITSISVIVLLLAGLTKFSTSAASEFSGTTRSTFVHYDEVRKLFTVSSKQQQLDSHVAVAMVDDAQNRTGWGFMEIHTNGKYDDDQQAYAAGLVEGAPPSAGKPNVLAMHIHNVIGAECKPPLNALCKRLKAYLELNFNYMYKNIEANPKDPYWHQVGLMLIQLNGLIDGFHMTPKKPSYKIENVLHPLVLLQIGGDMEDLQSALTGGHSKKYTLGSGSCSALIKLLDGNRELFIAQDTWNEFGSMLRYLKKYQFNFSTYKGSGTVIPGHTMTFSSYPGVLTSGDDFYTISTGLTTLETTIGNGNPKLWKFVTPEGTVLEWIRSMVANRITQSGNDWCKTFSLHNSGTYNNQWMIVDYKLFTPGSVPPSGTLYIHEQLPGTVHYADQTHVLLQQKYWPSYNVASFPIIFNMSGQPAMVKKYGDWFTYNHTARANIFRRDHLKVKDMNSMLKLMRYNDFKHDPLSACNCTPPYSAENAISARSDLNPKSGTYPFGALGHRAHGATDSKITSYKLFQTYQFLSISSPTYDDQPPFQWSTSDFKTKMSHLGHPDVWAFKPLIHEWKNISSAFTTDLN